MPNINILKLELRDLTKDLNNYTFIVEEYGENPDSSYQKKIIKLHNAIVSIKELIKQEEGEDRK